MGLPIRKRYIALAIAGLILTGCGTVTFDPGQYQTAVQLKYETLSLLDRTGERYAARRIDADSLLSRYASAADAAGKQPGNEQVIEMWQAIRDPLGGSAGTAIQLWKDKGPLKPGARAERKRLIASHFDRLICLESSKQAAKDCSEVGSAPTGVDAPSPTPQRRPSRAPKPAADAEPAEPDQPPRQ